VGRPAPAPGEPAGRRLAYDNIQRTHTVLVWESRPQAGFARPRRPAAGAPTPGPPPLPRPLKDTHRESNFASRRALQQIARDKGISVDTLLDALANALVAAYKRMPDAAEEAVVTVDPDSGEIRVYGRSSTRRQRGPRVDDTPKDFGRIAAQTAKQVILQRIREAERDLKYEE